MAVARAVARENRHAVVVLGGRSVDVPGRVVMTTDPPRNVAGGLEAGARSQLSVVAVPRNVAARLEVAARSQGAVVAVPKDVRVSLEDDARSHPAAVDPKNVAARLEVVVARRQRAVTLQRNVVTPAEVPRKPVAAAPKSVVLAATRMLLPRKGVLPSGRGLPRPTANSASPNSSKSDNQLD